MISVKGPGLKIFASIIAVIALAFGIYSTFFKSAGYETTTATIVAIEEDPDYIPDADNPNDKQYIVTAKYTVDGKEYTNKLDSYDPGYKVGSEVEIRYDPKNPEKMTSGFGIGIYFMVAGGAILILIIFLTIKKKTSVKKLKADVENDISYAPSLKGPERRLYFLSDVGTVKVGHRIEDKNREVLYEGKMTKFSPMSDFGFSFIDHEHGKTTAHLVGHQEDADWNSLLLDNHSTFTLDGEDIWKHLKRNGITVNSKLGDGNLLFPTYTIFRDGEQIAFVEASSQYVHEEDAEAHKVAAKIPAPGFYRISTTEKNLDLLFVTILAFARSSASDDKGGTRRILYNTIKG